MAGAKTRASVTVPAKTAETLSEEARKASEAAKEFSINLSKGQMTKDPEAIRFEDMARRGAQGKPAQAVAAPFFEQQFQDIGQAGRNVGEKLGRGQTVAETPSAAGSTITSEAGDAAQRARQSQEALVH